MSLRPSRLQPGWRDLERWTTHGVRPECQFDAWRDFVVDAHLHWSIRRVRCERFPAFIRQGRFDGFRTIHLTAPQGGVVGTRRAREIEQDDEALYNLIYVAEGTQTLTIGREDIHLGPGQFALWDSAKPMKFNTGHGLRQITFAVPRHRLQQVLPRADEFTARRIDASPGVSQLFINHMLALDARFGELSESDAGDILDATVDMLAATLCAKLQLPAGRTSYILLRQVMGDIDQHLDDPGLSTERIARDLGISQRQVYRLFEDAHTTPASWIRRRRLERCRRELASPGCAHLSVTDIAGRWGFFDSSTFSKVFKREFGVPPRVTRPLAGPLRPRRAPADPDPDTSAGE